MRADWCARTATAILARAVERDLPVDPGGPAPGIALRHLPHADHSLN